MAKPSKTQQLAEGAGQHLALAVAAHLARTQLVPDSLNHYHGARLSDALNAVAQALARVAALHVTDPRTGETRALGAAELEGAVVERGATVLRLKDGRELSGVSVRRADLCEAIALLRTSGVSELALPQPPLAPQTAAINGGNEAVRARFAELEKLLTPPWIAEQVDRAKADAVWIARHAPQGRVANLAMQLMSALHESTGTEEVPGGYRMALARLRAAIEQANV